MQDTNHGSFPFRFFLICDRSSKDGGSQSGDKDVDEDVFKTADEDDGAHGGGRVSNTCSVTTLRASGSSLSPARLFTKVASTSTDSVFYSLPRVENELKFADTQVSSVDFILFSG